MIDFEFCFPEIIGILSGKYSGWLEADYEIDFLPRIKRPDTNKF